MHDIRIFEGHEAYVLTHSPASSATPLSELAAVSLLARWLREDAQRAHLRRVVIEALHAPLSGTASDADVLRYLSACLAAGRLALCRGVEVHQHTHGHTSVGGTASDEAQEDDAPASTEPQIKPCDFEKVVIKCKHMGTKDRSMADAQFWRAGGNDMHNLPAPAAGRAHTNVIEVVGYHEERKADEITVTLQGGPGYTCGSEHPIIRVKSQVGAPKEFKGATTATFKAVCRTIPLQPANAGIFTVILHYFFPMQTLNVYNIDIESCGRLADGSYGFGRSQQKVRVYPVDLYKLSITIPALGKKTYERQRQQRAGGETYDATKSTSSNLIKGEKSTTATSTSVSDQRIKQTDEFKYETRQGGASEKRTQTLDAANNYKSETADKDTKPIDHPIKDVASSFKLTRNGGELEGTAEIGKYIRTLLELEKEVTEIMNFVKDFQPQVGWKFTFEISIFKGALEYEWGFKEWNDHTVYEWWKFKIEMTLFAMKLELSFGADIKVWRFCITCVIFGNISLDAKAAAEKEASPADSKPWELSVTSGVKGELGIRAALGADWVKAEGKLTVGLKFKAKCKVSTKEPFHIDWNLDFEGVKAKINGSVKWVGSIEREWTIVDEKKNWKKGRFPGAAPVLPAAA